MATLTVWKFDNPSGAGEALSKLESLQKQELIEIQDAAVVEWQLGNENPKTRQAVSLTGVGALTSPVQGMCRARSGKASKSHGRSDPQAAGPVPFSLRVALWSDVFTCMVKDACARGRMMLPAECQRVNKFRRAVGCGGSGCVRVSPVP